MNVIPILVARFASLLIAVLAVYRFGSTVPYMRDLPLAAYAVVLGSMLVFPLTISLILWMAPSTMLAVKADLAFDDSSTITPRVLSRIAVSLLAMWVLAFGLIDLVYFEAEVWAAKIAMPDTAYITLEQIAGRVTNIVQIIIGVGLWKQRYRLAKLVLGKYDAV